MPRILKDYLVFLKSKNYSPKTIEMYYFDIMDFFKFIKNYMNIEVLIIEFNIFILMRVKENEVDAFLVYLNYSKNNGSSTRRRKITAIRMFYKYLMNKYPNYIKENPVKEKWIQPTQRFPKHLSLEQAKNIIGIFNNLNSQYPERDNLIIKILLTTGIRREELANIDIKDIDLDAKTLKVIAKGNKERVIYLSERTTMQIKTFIQGKDKSLPLFISKQNKRMSGRSICSVVKKATELIGLKGYTTHSLRHTFASILYENEENILVVKESLGHNSLNSTQIYTHLSNKVLKDAMEKNPLNC